MVALMSQCRSHFKKSLEAPLQELFSRLLLKSSGNQNTLPVKLNCVLKCWAIALFENVRNNNCPVRPHGEEESVEGSVV